MSVMTKNKKYENAILESILRSSTDMAIAATDLDFRIQYYNPLAEKIFGYTAEEVIGKTVMEIHTKEKVDPSRFEKAVEIVRKEGAYLYTVERKKEDGPGFIESRVSGIWDRHNNLTGFVLMSRDNTEHRRAAESLRRTSRTLQILSKCNQAMIRAADETGLMKEVCRIIVESGGYRLAWVGFAEHDEEKTVRPVAQFGFDEGYLKSLNIEWSDTERGRGPAGRAIRSGKPYIARNILTDPNFALWRDAAIQRGYSSSISLPLVAGKEVFGAVNIYSTEPDAFDTEEVGLLKELAGDLSYGITTLRLWKEHISAEEELLKYRKHLERLVEERTVKLQSEITERKKIEIELQNKQFSLEELVAERTDDLQTAVKELQHQITERDLAEKALRESEERYRRITGAITDYIYTVHVKAGGAVETKHSETCLAVTGYRIQDFMADPYLWIKMVPEEDRDLVRKQIQQVLSGLSAQSIEHRIIRKEGAMHWVESSIVPNMNTDADLISYDGIVRDITGRKHAEAEVERKNKVLDAINRVFRDAIMCETEEELARTCLSVAEELTGSTLGFFGELNRDGLFDTLAISNPGWDACRVPKGRATLVTRNMAIRGIDRSAMLSGESRIVNGEEAFARHPDHVGFPVGHPKMTAYLGVPFRHDGKIIGMVGLGNKKGGYTPEDLENIETLSVAMVEALKSKRAEKMMKESQERFRLLVDGVRDYAIFMLDPKGHIVSWNEGAKRLNGYDESEVRGRHFSCFFTDEDIKNGKPVEELEIAAAEDHFEDEGWRVRKDSSRFYTYAVITALRDKAGGLKGFAKIMCDITERRNMVNELKQHREHLEELVTERTNKLKKEISERKKVERELRRNMEELERFSRLATGREKQMVRLKQEVNEYLMELGRDAKYKIIE